MKGKLECAPSSGTGSPPPDLGRDRGQGGAFDIPQVARDVGADLIRLSGVEFRWPGPSSFALSVPEFSLASGERVLLTGPSGAGKSTFLSLLAGILTPQKGSIIVAGTDIAQLKGAARDRFRAEHFGIIFQMFNLLPYGSVVDNVILPLRFANVRRKRVKANVQDEAISLLGRLGLPDDVVARGAAAASLSVGQQQRVAAARALIGEPDLIIADEPTSALDTDTANAFLDLLFADLAKRSTTLLMVSHDLRLAPRFSRVLDLGQIAHISRGGAE